MKNPRGFTLVELLVAITVLAIVAVMGWRGLDTIIRSREKLTQNMEQTRSIQLSFAQLQSDLEQLADKPLLREHQNLLADNTRLVFIRTVLVENAASQLQVVSYNIRDGVLSRSESAVTRDLAELDGLWQSAIGQGGTQAAVGLQTGVESMAVRIWEIGGWKLPQYSSTSFENAVPKEEDAPCTSTVPGACQGQGSGGNPSSNPSGKAPLPVQVPQRQGPIGLEISLQLQGQPAPLIKVFLLGAA
ncbi:PulJ/GspJ family protein [Pseudoduganella violaceinigra]|uniref:PulJ/GspJ family protein n=1 Tax=Pseudoduganella violaceinigra TaxID=246602 RepID=UPI000410398D|nr:prepilin-type N-terminal cleavage/methylation domain-containing protein [Pseudoduganella violaceinigra]